MKTPANGDPELRIRIPVRSSIETRVAKGDDYVAVQVTSFLKSTLVFEVHDTKACDKLVEAFTEAKHKLVAQAAVKRNPKNR